MVQRKVNGNKLGVQDGYHGKPEKKRLLLGSLKPSSSSHHPHPLDGKPRAAAAAAAADLKKKMKKSSRPAKKSDFDGLSRQVPQPPAKESPAKKLDASPNYMKSTSSSDAKKESPQPQESSRRPQLCNTSNNSKHGSGNGHKPAKTSARSCSLKLVRTPSFKPARSSSRKCSTVVLCEDLEVQRATCSSTLKDSKFPPYLDLIPGATESEGTSVMRVCPYTYCSLNGLHLTPLPPLKCFVSARRRMIKAQKGFKHGCLSPRRRHRLPSGEDFMKESATAEPDFSGMVINPPWQEDNNGFFIEIYAANKGDTAEEHGDEEPAESGLPDERQLSDMDFEDKANRISESMPAEMDISELLITEDQVADEAEFIPPTSLALDQSTVNSLFNQNDLEIEPEDLDSEASDMEWEAISYSDPYLDGGSQMNNESEVKKGGFLEIEICSLHDEPIFKSDEVFRSSCNKIPADLQDNFDEESVSSEAWLGESDTESDCSYHNQQGDDAHIQVFNNQAQEQLTPSADDEATSDPEFHQSNDVTEGGGVTDEVLDGCLLPWKASSESDQSSLEKGLPITDVEDEDEKKRIDASTSLIGIQILDSQGSYEAEQATTDKDDETPRPNATVVEDGELSRDSADEGLPAASQDQILDEQSQGNTVAESLDPIDKDQDESKRFKKSNLLDSEDQMHSRVLTLKSTKNTDLDVDVMELKQECRLDAEESYPTVKNASNADSKIAMLHAESYSKHEESNACKNSRWTYRGNRPVEEPEDPREFNPREPNFLPVEPDPEAEKVDLRHQMMDERKNAEEWMVDHALQQAVNKLAPARKRKVALLVEAFETVIPIPKYDTRHLRHTAATFAHSRTIQACR